jgi:hypothetical protein
MWIAKRIVKNEGFPALYKGLVPVVCGIIPKMAIRFSSFEYYKQLLADESGKVSTGKVCRAIPLRASRSFGFLHEEYCDPVKVMYSSVTVTIVMLSQRRPLFPKQV